MEGLTVIWVIFFLGTRDVEQLGLLEVTFADLGGEANFLHLLI
jgi:hypothetical protein